MFSKRYSIYGLILQSDIPLPELIECSDRRSETQIRVTSESKDSRFADDVEWFIDWKTESGQPWLLSGKDAHSYRLRFDQAGDFRINREGTEICCQQKTGISEDTLRHLLLNQVIPMVLNLRGTEALHASAVAMPEGAVAFCGESGAGKSTLAAIFQQGGIPLLTDDCLALSETSEGICVAPGYPGLRLWKSVVHELDLHEHAQHAVAHYTAKRRVDVQRDAETYCSSPQILRAIYVIAAALSSGDDHVRIETLTPKEQLMALLSYCFRLDITDRTMLARQFQFFSRIPARIRMRRISLPRNPQRFADTRKALLADLASMGAPEAAPIASQSSNSHSS